MKKELLRLTLFGEKESKRQQNICRDWKQMNKREMGSRSQRERRERLCSGSIARRDERRCGKREKTFFITSEVKAGFTNSDGSRFAHYLE